MYKKIVAFYMRLSVEADGETEESMSIANQRAIIEDFLAAQADLIAMERMEYIDEGYTGTNMKRPAMAKLLEDVSRGRVGCIIVKDFSRFVRNHVLQGQFLEILFPSAGVRFISVNDHFDSREKTNGLLLPLMGLTYELYARDMSKKIKSIKKNQAQSGIMRPCSAPYGYDRDAGGKGYVVDRTAAEIVRRIYTLALEGWPCIKIARLLNDEKIPSPGAYKRLKGMNRSAKENALWNSQSVRTILRDEVYLGTYVLHKRTCTGFGVKRRRRTAREDWYMFPRRHEAIISRKEFERVQQIRHWRPMDVRNKKPARLLDCPIICGICERALRRTSGSRDARYKCVTADYISDCGCMKGDVGEKDMAGVLFYIILLHCGFTKGCTARRYQGEEICEAAKQEDKKRVYREASVYEKYKDGLISKEEYMRLKKQYETEENWEGEEKTGLQKQAKKSGRFLTDCTALPECTKSCERTVKPMVEKILVYDEEKMEIYLGYTDIYREAMHCICGDGN